MKTYEYKNLLDLAKAVHKVKFSLRILYQKERLKINALNIKLRIYKKNTQKKENGRKKLEINKTKI